MATLEELAASSGLQIPALKQELNQSYIDQFTPPDRAMSSRDMITYGITSALPVLLGALIRGKEGASIGAKAGLVGSTIYGQQLKQDEEDAQNLAKARSTTLLDELRNARKEDFQTKLASAKEEAVRDRPDKLGSGLSAIAAAINSSPLSGAQEGSSNNETSVQPVNVPSVLSQEGATQTSEGVASPAKPVIESPIKPDVTEPINPKTPTVDEVFDMLHLTEGQRKNAAAIKGTSQILDIGQKLQNGSLSAEKAVQELTKSERENKSATKEFNVGPLKITPDKVSDSDMGDAADLARAYKKIYDASSQIAEIAANNQMYGRVTGEGKTKLEMLRAQIIPELNKIDSLGNRGNRGGGATELKYAERQLPDVGGWIAELMTVPFLRSDMEHQMKFFQDQIQERARADFQSLGFNVSEIQKKKGRVSLQESISTQNSSANLRRDKIPSLEDPSSWVKTEGGTWKGIRINPETGEKMAILE